MNHDEKPNPPDLQPFIEPELEARVVAWVLGEASAFEAAELERLASEKPELAIFKRRIGAVHGLLGEAVHTEKEPLRLAPERRAKLLGALGTPATSESKPVPASSRAARNQQAKKRIRREYWWTFGAAALLPFCALLFFAIQSIDASRSYQAKKSTTLHEMQAFQERQLSNQARQQALALMEARTDGREATMDTPVVELPEAAPIAAHGEIKIPVNRSPPRSRSAGSSERTQPGQIQPPPLTLSDSASAVSVTTRQFLADTGATNNQRALGYTTNTEVGGATGNFDKDFTWGVSAGRGGGAAQIQSQPNAIVFGRNSATGGSSTNQIADTRFTIDGTPLVSVDAFGDIGTQSVRGFIDADPGYVATATLSGTRMNMALPDLANSVTVVTKQELADVAATDVSNVFSYEANAEGADAKDAAEKKQTEERTAASEPKGITPPQTPEVVQTFQRASTRFPESARYAGPVAQLYGIDHPSEQALARAEQAFLNGALEKPAEAAMFAAFLAYELKDYAKASRFLTQAEPFLSTDRERQDHANLKAAIDAALAEERSKTPPLPAIEETHTSKEPVSTFSLHVSDVSFRLAQAALARGEAPDPATIRPEEFYNAFDYGDPAPTVDEKIACRIEQAAHPFLQQRTLLRIAVRVPATGRGAGQPLRLTVLLDTSGSMEREDRVASVRRAVEVLAGLLGPNDRMTLIGFARTPRLLVESLPGDQAAQLADLIARTPAEGGTNLEEALKLADELARRQQDAAAQNRIVLITDGAANLGSADPAQLATAIEALRQRGIAFDACGVGTDGLDDAILEALTRKGDGRYYVLDSPADADAGFAAKLAGAFRPAAQNVKLQVRLNPARVGAYRLLGFEQHRLREEDFRNDKVDAAELASEEAAVALYQVEVLPQGEGELGEVFVRFRDTAGGAMVERSWPIAHDGRVPSFDKAPPTLQLAGVAALLADYLRDAPGAEAMELGDLVPVVNTLRGRFARNARVQELVTMFEQLRRMEAK
jgi:secreted protein with Ig-like and vWFA domain